MLQQLNRRGPLPRVAKEAFIQEIDPSSTELVRVRQLWRVALGDIEHDGPFVVEGCPGAATGGHLEDHAAEGPDVDGAGAAGVLALDDFGGHVHGGSGHGFVGFGDGGGFAVDEGFALAGDHFGGAEIDVFDYAVVVEEDVY